MRILSLSVCFLMLLFQTASASVQESRKPAAESPSSTATLKTAKTIFVEPMEQDLHVALIIELRKQKGLYEVVFDAQQADLWMKGAVSFDMLEPGGGLRGAVRQRMAKRDSRMKATVSIVSRGGTNVLWTAEAKDVLMMADQVLEPQVYIAKQLVKKLRQAARGQVTK